ncbi:phosphatidylinositol N-acetylglucosaminyltransferase subunit A-like isoform X3 [Convolutriloba macropyga]|uniref:phosphatidylinositol N-acetylglucosaminyltransferase subunit A-like isoform X3 n=1 Tax=Convolutriloba macropyga TaxID=536237 RepID=UPI003F51E630
MGYNICMLSDFFYPNVGGVESHIFQVSLCLIEPGHSVTIVTHAYGERKGVRYITKGKQIGIKTYYLPFKPVYNQAILPSFILTIPLLRNIFIREQIEIVHAHGAFSVIGNQALFHAIFINPNLKTVFTDHSLFGFADTSAIITNKVLQIALWNVDSAICVSHTGKENTVLRGKVKAELIYVIPNAVDTRVFFPDLRYKSNGKIGLVVMSRLVYRKGIDILAKIIAPLCAKYPNVEFHIGGDGPKMVLLEEITEKHHLQNRVFFYGSVKHERVRNILVKGHIFLNMSLTEAFCTAIVEAACCGLHVVSTKVGGVPEVLPPEVMTLAPVDPALYLEVVERVIEKHQKKAILDREQTSKLASGIYRWKDIAQRTEVVYNNIFKQDSIGEGSRKHDYPGDPKRSLWKIGFFFGKIAYLIALWNILVVFICEWMFPKETIDICPKLLPEKKTNVKTH